MRIHLTSWIHKQNIPFSITMMNKAATAFALLLLCLTTACSGFTAPRSSMNPSMSSARFASKEQRQQESDFDVMGIAASTLSFWATSASVASAAGPDWGIFEGKTMSRKCRCLCAWSKVCSIQFLVLSLMQLLHSPHRDRCNSSSWSPNIVIYNSIASRHDGQLATLLVVHGISWFSVETPTHLGRWH